MARTPTAKPARPAFHCTECGWTTSKWVGRCGECQAWGTVSEVGGARSSGRTTAGPVTQPARPMTEISIDATRATSSGVGELDRVLGGGVVQGAALLLAGEPGVGKSTLLLEVAAQWARLGRRTLYVSGEESAAQVRLRADRTGAVEENLYLAAETDLGAVLGHVDQVEPSLLVVDSVQTISSSEVEGVPGGVTQVREVSAALTQVAKRRGIATLLVGHVTKDGAIAGPRVLEHLVDVVLSFEGDRHSRLRVVRAVKNRYGPVDEIGCFDLSEEGIVEVSDPTGLFVSRHAEPVPGTCVTVTLEGRRPLLAEIQALVAPSSTPSPRRAASGLDSTRVAMVIAVLARRCGVGIAQADVYTATVGGARLGEPAADLATAVAIASAAREVAVPSDVVALGEVGLAGEVRRVAGVQHRLREAARLGFKRALVPSDHGAAPAPADVDGIQVVPVADLASALRALGLQARTGASSPSDDADAFTLRAAR
ncbi:MAG: DNA repair protein RadA [Nocardioidaceae bacterium]|nr:DNA repair protein RadA [Nocardioidaceae bacterium]